MVGWAQQSRAGALLGLAVGDALGTTLEFTRLQAPPFPQLARGPHTHVAGGGPFDLAPGQVTDDTQMACCLAASIRALGRFDAADAAARYVEWQIHAFDIGRQTAASLALVRQGHPPLDAGREVWARAHRDAAGNGSLMRTAAIGALLEDPIERRRASVEDSAITHFDPRCGLACAALNAAIAAAREGTEPVSPSLLWEAAKQELPPAALELEQRWPAEAPHVSRARAALEADLAAASRDDPELYGPELHLQQSQGFVRVAFRLAFWELLHVADFRAALIDCVNRGGDADTNGAITGALLGAAHGEAAIPVAWRDRVLGALAGRHGPLASVYHPRTLLG
ncbi:MAG: ADP-ribosylglycohydrolase family protein [Deltaproteobacteria bacterium]|nr:ADP-ribosylglycohydrolase family protein [Deltaproteobacteria bacterium]